MDCCGLMDDGYTCTLSPGHTGEHLAADGTRDPHRWANACPDCATERTARLAAEAALEQERAGAGAMREALVKIEWLQDQKDAREFFYKVLFEEHKKADAKDKAEEQQ